MHSLEVAILEAFKQEPSRSFSTTDLVRLVFKEEYSAINQELHSQEKREIRHGYSQKAKLHRKLLYHVNNLVEQRLLRVQGTKGKGEKLVRLGFEEGEIVIQEKRQKIVITKPPSVATQADGYEQQGFLRKYKPENWLHKQNSVMLDCSAFQTGATLLQRVQSLFPAVNDVIFLNCFEQVLEQSTEEELDRFCHALALDSRDYDVSVSLLINVNQLEHEERCLRVLRLLATQEHQAHVNFVFAVTPRLFTKRDAFFQQLITLFAERRVKFTLKNNEIFAPPIFYGRAGAYALTPEEWEYYRLKIREHADGCVVGHSSVVVDINKFFEAKGNATAFREMILRIAHAFFEMDERKRRHFASSFGAIAPPSNQGTKEFFKVGKDYLRFWNFDWATEEYPLIELLTSVQEEVQRFCTTEETIFRSCGLPIRFNVSLSTSFAKFDQDFFSERRYTKTVVSSLKDLQTKEMAHYLGIRERLFKVFQGADRLRFFFTRGTSQEEVLQMARYLLRAYDLPAFTFDFRGKSGELKLSSFLEGQ